MKIKSISTALRKFRKEYDFHVEAVSRLGRAIKVLEPTSEAFDAEKPRRKMSKAARRRIGTAVKAAYRAKQAK
jgi:hypothetical protein